MTAEDVGTSYIIERRGRITDAEVLRLHQHRRDKILSDKSVKGEESPLHGAEKIRKKGKVNGQKRGHNGRRAKK